MKLPPPLSWLWAGWQKVGHAIGRVISFVILTVLWIVGFGTYGIVMKIIRLFKREEKKDSYWMTPDPLTEDHLLRQF